MRLRITALAEHSLGHAAESQTALQELIANNRAAEVAEVYAWKGDADRAFEWMDRAFDQKYALMKIDPFFVKLHGDPRWAAVA